MSQTVKSTTILNKLSLLTLVVLILLSFACDKNNSGNRSGSQNQPANAASATTPANTISTARSPDTSSSANSPTETNAIGPSIQITEVPSKGAGPDALETIAGKVSGVKVKDCKVVIYARTNTWYVQPYIDSSDTAINDDGTWRNDTHLGSQYAALLVKASYKPSTTTGKLPAIGGPILAIATANAK